MGKTGLAATVTAVLLGGTYLYTLPSASRGYGYMGYGGYHRGPSSWYWSDAAVFRGPSARNGSLGGPRHRGGGLAGGK